LCTLKLIKQLLSFSKIFVFGTVGTSGTGTAPVSKLKVLFLAFVIMDYHIARRKEITGILIFLYILGSVSSLQQLQKIHVLNCLLKLL
jgi:hypothetical protein